MNTRILQIRTNALTAEYIYTKQIKKLKYWNTAINVLTFIVPLLFTAALYITKNTVHETLVNNISVILGVLLLSITSLSFLFEINSKRENYIIGRRSNIYVANEALKLLDKEDSELNWFYNYLVEIDSKDTENIEEIDKELKKAAYRNSLERLIPGSTDTCCSVCHASPFIYNPGSCQTCGNTPRSTL
jgi:mobilome CxxCx(11)CxxC protein